MKFGTIVARNYLPQARVLSRSVREHHPDLQLAVLIVDGDPAENLTASDDLDVLYPRDLDLPAAEFARMRAIYDVTELATALKPSLLAKLRQHDDVAVYLDPDVRLFTPLDELSDLAQMYGIVLTPHAVDPYPRDGLLLDEGTILRAGVFNLGFIAVGPGSETFLAWWAERLSRDALIAPEVGMFTDQRWIDLVPTLFECHVIRDKGWNVAYWNLHERVLRREEATGSVYAGDRPLRFLHFSGYDPDQPHVVSKHQGDRPRVVRSGQPLLGELLDAYGDELWAAGWAQRDQFPYRWAEVAGQPMHVFLRRLLRDPEGGGIDSPAPDPHAPGGLEDFRAWMSAPVAAMGDSRLPRVVHEIWKRRRDLQQTFPHPLGGDLRALVAWAGRARDRAEDADLVHLWEPNPEPARPAAKLPSAGPGITVAGYLRAELGVGEAGRLMLLGAEQVGLPVSTLTYGQTRSRQEHRVREWHGDVHDLCVMCVNADQTTSFLGRAGAPVQRAALRAGLWFWEVEDFPEGLRAAARALDEVWVASPFVRDAVADVVDVPVRLVPLPIVADPPTHLSRADLGLPEDRWLCGFAFDVLSVVQRKNPVGVVQAYRQAFAPEDGAFLLVKVHNGWANRNAIEHLAHLAADRPDIRVVDASWPVEYMQALFQLLDCYVSLHRSEGFGLTIAQAMAQGKPVVATGYSGNLAFMTDHNSLLVPFTKQPVGPEATPYPADSLWAEPDTAAAAELLRRLHDDPAFAAFLGARAAHDMRAHHHPGVCADFLREAALTASRRSLIGA